jgi:TM2 domain-containing membrane protein YozV
VGLVVILAADLRDWTIPGMSETPGTPSNYQPNYPPPPYQNAGYNYQPAGQPECKKTTAGILALLLGGLGVHKFYLGYTKEGVLQILLTVGTCGFGSVVSLVEGITYLTKNDQEFVETYQLRKKGWF